jgi:hypothetical protein
MTVEPVYDLKAVAASLGMSTRWVRDRIRLDGVEHIRLGNRIRFTQAQVEKLRAAHTQTPAAQSITTGRKKKTA